MRDVALIVHFIGLGMGVGTSFAMMFLGIQSKKLEESEAVKFMTNALILARMGHLGLGLLLLSGLYLIMPYHQMILENHLLLTKLVLVLVLGGILGALGSNAKKAQKADDPRPYLQKIEKMGKIAMLVVLTILILAVSVFH